MRQTLTRIQSKRDGYDFDQQTAIRHTDGSMLVAAGPGSGKTTVITERIRYLITSAGVSPADILVLTFTRAAANEMEQRFRILTQPNSYPVRFGTFHSIFFWILKTAYNLDNTCIMTDEEKRVLAGELIKKLPVRFDNREDVVSSALAQMSLVKCDMIDIENYYSHDMPEEAFRALYRQMSEEKKKARKIDFDDILVLCYELLVNRGDILERCRKLFPYIMVDEFQDSNRLQYEILKLLAKPKENIFAVGDDDQSVYGFRGARPEIMQQFCRDFPKCRRVTLGNNYRCAKEIVEASGTLIENNKRRFAKELKACDRRSGKVKLVFCADGESQSNLLVQAIRANAARGVPYERQAVLYRMNMEPRRLIHKLNSYNLPYTVSDSVPNLMEHFVVRTALDYMHAACGDCSRERILRIINRPVRYLKRDLLVENPVSFSIVHKRLRNSGKAAWAFEKFTDELQIIKKKKPAEAVRFLRETVGYDAYLKDYADERQMDVGELYDVLDEFSAMLTDMNSFGEVFLLVEEYTELMREQGTRNKDRRGVSLLTMHSAKGLEFDCVYIMDAVEGFTPYRRAKTPSELEEERRMFYVAMTRAKQELTIYIPERVTGKQKEESRFVKEIRSGACKPVVEDKRR